MPARTLQILNSFKFDKKQLSFILMVALLLPANVVAATTALDWLQGSWCMSTESGIVEEVWLSEVDGQLIGMGRTTDDGKVASYEFMHLVTADGKTRFTAQPAGGAGTSFIASLVAENHLVVENPAHDFPQKIEYRREADALHATISGPADDGEEMSFSFDYQRCES